MTQWIHKFADNGWMDHICPICGFTENTDVHVQLDWNYCPNCGARMKEYIPECIKESRDDELSSENGRSRHV